MPVKRPTTAMVPGQRFPDKRKPGKPRVPKIAKLVPDDIQLARSAKWETHHLVRRLTMHMKHMMGKTLSELEIRFVFEFINDPTSASRAARNAGFSAKQAQFEAPGWVSYDPKRNKKPHILRAVEYLRSVRFNEVIMKVEEAKLILSHIARGSIIDFMDEEGRVTAELGNPHCVSELTFGFDQANQMKTTKLKLHSKIDAIQRLASLEGWDAPAKIENVGFSTFAEMVRAATKTADELEPLPVDPVEGSLVEEDTHERVD